ncbi:hypothetical protein JF66_00245 [Cryobacterium sp. MLB-32]|uniref:lycopene cyclase domain-containing protein n=1 Tax=Cryobacterium sp. MLB-32 TaxID=1529318 RepID=UPI0004E6A1AE|nr:lycopene cyclase domain-containing protein [Cryobacterium sp. MLB-32]KFF61060.1 hypothetical protein JF66_00245 [Cryobacterium sp. MLB-32]
MTYLILNAGFLLVVTTCVVAAALRGLLTRRLMASMGIALGIVLTLTAVFDNVMISAGLFSYDPAHLVGWFVGLAPLEDFAYPLAAVLLLPSIWVLVGARKGGARADA